MRSRLIVQLTKSSRGPVDKVAYSVLVHSIISIDYGMYPISNVPYRYTITISILSLFTLYRIKLLVLH